MSVAKRMHKVSDSKLAHVSNEMRQQGVACNAIKKKQKKEGRKKDVKKKKKKRRKCSLT
jgi:hypothetical protein